MHDSHMHMNHTYNMLLSCTIPGTSSGHLNPYNAVPKVSDSHIVGLFLELNNINGKN